MKQRIQRLLLALGLVAPMLAAVPVRAATNTINFEQPTYSVGNIHNQDGWSKTGLYDAEVASSNGVAGFGDQSLRISNAVTSTSFGDHTFSKSLSDEAGETAAESGGMSGGTRSDYFEAEWEFASMVPGSEQPGLSVVASPDRGDGARMSWVQMVDTPTGVDINFNDYQDGIGFVQSNVVSGLDRTVPHTIKITMQFVDGEYNDVVEVYVDGTLEHTGTSWEGYFNDAENNPTRTVDSVLFRVGGTAAPATLGNGFLIDNLNMTTEAPVTADTTAPSVPVALGASTPVVPCGGTTSLFNVVIDWTDSTDNVGVVGYNYFIVTPNLPGGWPTTTTESSRPGEFNSGEGTYTYKVNAFDAAGNVSAWSNECSITYDDPSTLENKEECKNGGWKLSSMGFKNQGDCVSYFATGGRNKPANAPALRF